MTLELYLAYVVATLVVLAVPGPTILLIISYALSQGRRAALSTVVGVGLGDAIAVTVSLAGLGAVMATSATAFTVLKWVGAAYLVYLGIKMWRTNPSLSLDGAQTVSARRMTLHTTIVTALNPKGIAFFVAFLPHFLNPAAPAAPQLVLLGTTFVVLGIANAALYALFAAHLRARITKPGTLRWANRAGGTMLLGAGLVTATLRRT
ncbi:MAG: LysE family translocator [Devosiaceae bacterium]|nr:LysE family translocator [Devosiaceae bacterium MH13]